MRWDRLLADIEAAEAARERADMIGEAAERTRHEIGQITIEARLSAALGSPLTVEVEGPQRCVGVLEAVGRGWIVLVAGPVSWLVPLAHLRQVVDLPRHAAPPRGDAAARVYDGLGLRHALRGISADRSPVQIGLGAGGPLAGTIDRVGADFIDVAVHSAGEARRAKVVHGVRTVPTEAVRYVRRGAEG